MQQTVDLFCLFLFSCDLHFSVVVSNTYFDDLLFVKFRNSVDLIRLYCFIYFSFLRTMGYFSYIALIFLRNSQFLVIHVYQWLLLISDICFLVCRIERFRLS